jgi:hypothetical protein
VANDNSPGGPSGRPSGSDGPAADEQDDIVVTPAVRARDAWSPGLALVKLSISPIEGAKS